MKISDKQLCRVHFVKKFNTLYQLEENTQLILNTLCVYAMKYNDYQKVDFEIYTEEDNKKYIVPRYNAARCDYFMLGGERLAMCKIVEIKSDDYINIKNNKGDFTFTLEL